MPESTARLPVAVVGCGRMGRLHARVYSQMPTVELVGVYDRDPQVAAAVADEYGTAPVAAVDELYDRVRAVTIAVPTVHHVEMAAPFLAQRVACLIEKPLAEDVAQARRIADAAAESGAIVQVGHIERFNPAVRAMQRHAVRPGFIEVTRISPLTFRSIDVGVVLDVMIHDIDIVLKLAGSPVERIEATGVSVIGITEDIANARLTFANGCVANLTASRLALKTERKLRVFSENAYVSLDYQQKRGVLIRRGENIDDIRRTVEKIRLGEITDFSQIDYAELVDVEQLEIDDAEPLRVQLDSFISAVTAGTPVEVPASDGLAAVETAERIVAAIGKRMV